MPQGAPASAACVVLAGTADGFDKETAVSRAQRSLEDYIQQYKAENHLGAVTVSAITVPPMPSFAHSGLLKCSAECLFSG